MNGLSGNMSPRRLSRETRHLLVAAFAALLALWLLARLRFPERTSIVNPIPPLLTQLSVRPGFSELEAELARLHARLSPSLIAFRRSSAPGEAPRDDARTALRIDDGLAIALLETPQAVREEVVSLDATNGLALLRVPDMPRTYVAVPWAAERLDVPRYFVAAVAAGGSVTLQPVVIGALVPQPHPAWTGGVWRMTSAVALPVGTMLFTHEGELVGAVDRDDGRPIVVPGDVLLTEAQRLLTRDDQSHVDLGTQVQALTAPLRAATGSSGGVIVAWVQATGAAATHLMVGDVIEAINGAAVESPQDWLVRVSRLRAGETITLAVVRLGERTSISLTAPQPSPSEPRALGMRLRWIAGVGSEVLVIEPRSSAAGAGLAVGDLILNVGRVQAPTAAQVVQAFAAADPARPIVVGVARGDRRLVVALGK
jgi:S1-C subfamily serine protease